MSYDLEEAINKYPELPQLFYLFRTQFFSDEDLIASVFAKAKRDPSWRGEEGRFAYIYENIKLPPLGPFRIFEASFNNGQVEFFGILCRDGDSDHLEKLELYFQFHPGQEIEFNKDCIVRCWLDPAWID